MRRTEPRQHGFLFDLPDAALHLILHKAGLCSRELCRALLDLYGPLPRLTPCGVDTPDELLSALAGSDRHRHLTALNLSHVNKPLTDDSLQALCTALPNLCALCLPPPSCMHGCDNLTAAAGVAAAVSRLPHLTALHVPFLSGLDDDPPPEWPIEGCAPLQELTLPAPFLVAPNSAALSRLTALSKLCCQGGTAAVDVSRVVALVAPLPALAALQLGGRFEATQRLRDLGRLTALRLSGWVGDGGGVTVGQLLQHVGSLTNLRNLVLQLEWDVLRDATEAGWATNLTCLTSLRVEFDATSEALLLQPALDDVVSSVPHLPALRALHIADTSDFDAMLVGASAWPRAAAAAGSSLQLLHMAWVRLPTSMFTHVLPQLTGLTCLRLEGVRVSPVNDPSTMSFGWLAALTALRELGWRYSGEVVALPCEVLRGLSHVATLSLAGCHFVDGPYLEQLCEAMPQLRSLNLSENWKAGVGLRALQQLTHLEVLGLMRVPHRAELLAPDWVPWSLRRCHLDWLWHADRAGVRALVGRHVEAVFSDWQQE